MILRNSTRNRFLNPISPVSTYTQQDYTRYGPPIRPAQPLMRANQVSDYLTPQEMAFNQAWTLGQGPAANRFAQRYMTGAAFSGGLAQVGELAGHAIGQSVLNRAFSVAQGGGGLAPLAQTFARRIALRPGEFMAGVLGNIGHLAGVGLSQPRTGETRTTKPEKPPKPINMEPVRAIAQKTIQSQLKRTRTPAAGGSRAF